MGLGRDTKNDIIMDLLTRALSRPSVLTDFTTASQFAHHKPHADFFSSLTILFLCSSVNFAWKGLKFNSMRSYHHKRQQTQLQPPHHHSKDLQFPTAAPAK